MRMRSSRPGITQPAFLGFLLMLVLVVSIPASELVYRAAVVEVARVRQRVAARLCQENILALASAGSEFALRNGRYTSDPNDLARYYPGSRQSLERRLVCPLDGVRYVFTAKCREHDAKLHIACPNAHHHAAIGGKLEDYERVMVMYMCGKLPWCHPLADPGAPDG